MYYFASVALTDIVHLQNGINGIPLILLRVIFLIFIMQLYLTMLVSIRAFDNHKDTHGNHSACVRR